MAQQLIDAITGMREDDVLNITKELLKGSTEPLDILADCRTAMEIIGERFQQSKAFIPDLILAGEMLKQVSELVRPLLKSDSESAKKLGKVVIGTVAGDIHDIAKDIVAFMMEVNGFEVIDLGVDVPPAKFAETAAETGAKIVGLSGFLTLAYDPMKETVEAIRKADLGDVKVMIGGGQVDDQIREYTGADAFGSDAMTAVTIARQWVKEADNG